MTSILALDAAYSDTGAHGVAAAALAGHYRTPGPYAILTISEGPVADYEPGAFYKRELPLLLAAIEEADPTDILLIDGYVRLDAAGRPGLGAHLFEALGRERPVIGAAKNRFRGDDVSVPVLRGESAKPLYVTAEGIAPARAAAIVSSLSGATRIPDIAKAADRAARDLLAALERPEA